MSAVFVVNLTFAIVGIAPVAALLLMFRASKIQNHGLWVFGVLAILLGTFEAGIATELLTAPQTWLPEQSDPTLVSDGKEAVLHLKVWVYVLPAATIALGVNLLTAFLVKPYDS